MYPVDTTKGMHAARSLMSEAGQAQEGVGLTNADESKLPAVRETNNGTSNQTGDTLHNPGCKLVTKARMCERTRHDSRPQCDTSQTVDLLGIVTQARGQATSLRSQESAPKILPPNWTAYAVLILVKELDLYSSMSVRRSSLRREIRARTVLL
jgi:hypothetical protein